VDNIKMHLARTKKEGYEQDLFGSKQGSVAGFHG
jgi:hypothetical protein